MGNPLLSGDQPDGICHSGTGRKDAILHSALKDFDLCKLGH